MPLYPCLITRDVIILFKLQGVVRFFWPEPASFFLVGDHIFQYNLALGIEYCVQD